MNDIDDKIREALQAEDAELFAEYGGEQSMWPNMMMIAPIKTAFRWPMKRSAIQPPGSAVM